MRWFRLLGKESSPTEHIKKRNPVCSFCKRVAKEVRYLVAESKKAAICNECALITLDILLEKRDSELAALLERHHHLVQIDNPAVSVREIQIRPEYQLPALLILGFLPTFLARLEPAISVESRLDITSFGIRLSLRSSDLHREAVEEALVLYGDILVKRKGLSDLSFDDEGKQDLMKLVRTAEEQCVPKSPAHTKNEYSPIQAIGWVLSGECEDFEGLLS